MADRVPGSSKHSRISPSLEQRYIDCCWRHGVLPNKALLSAFFKVEVKKTYRRLCSLVVFLDDLKDADFLPLLDIFMEIDTSEIDAVDIFHNSSCDLNGEYVLLLLRAINQKLRVVNVRDATFGKEFLRNLSQRGLTCQVLNLRSSHFRKLNMVGNFSHLRTLNLDFSSSLSSFREDCFTCMPNLKCLSLCETRIANLWTTNSALSKLPSLVELRFQHCLCCDDTGPHPASSGGKSTDSCQLDSGLCVGAPSPFDGDYFWHMNMEEADIYDEVESTFDDSSDDSEVDFTNHCREPNMLEACCDVIPAWNGLIDLQSEISFGPLPMQDEDESSSSCNSKRISSFVPKKYISCHPSPICYEKHYREYMIASLPSLKVLDNLPIRKIDRERANIIFSQHFEYLPYRRKTKENVVSILHNREIKAGCNHSQNWRRKPLYVSAKSQYSYSRSLSAAKVGSTAWPLLHPLSILGSVLGGENRNFRPRQFEYHPSDSSLMAFGTLDGEVVVINHENGKIVSYIPSLGAMNGVLGLCWLKKYPSKLIAGSDNGSLKLYDIKHISSRNKGIHSGVHSVNFDDFDQLTSVHVNSTNDWFVASGYSKNVALYDIGCGRRLQVFTDMHRGHINVVKFSNHSPSIFATSSFDQDVKMWDLRQKPIFPCYTASSTRGNVMVCFSPDDHYLLVSAVDNEVKQLLAADGRLHLNFNIVSTGSSQNYTRSYYMNGRDYIISGSCDENVVRICCAQTGRRLRDISLEGKSLEDSMFVQSLRGDPFRDFNMSILAAYIRPSSNSEIVKVNLLASRDYAKDFTDDQHSRPSYSMGG
ncbi:DNA damage-binding protein like [Actinidia chinensis var. chinensis]|uniref:DNA damage-binding protein like n=1 Tax=Actinidia chinensis var. chinensis TaxID=1590841 RepID=A0A2R6RC61_ACTCC|nr:DNA damage-binding protein like [Actinidia chinensis var. chinensis]